MELAARTGLTYADFSVPLGTIGDHLPVLEHATRSVARQGKPVRHVFLLLDVDFLGRRPITTPASRLTCILTLQANSSQGSGSAI